MNTALKALYALQQVDSALALAERQYRALDPGRAEQSAAEEARRAAEEAAAAHQQTTRDLRDAELELKSVETKKKDFEGRLYGGKISLPKEMTAAQQEIEALGRQRGRLDERILTLMEEVEVRQAEDAQAQQTLAAAEAQLARKQAEYKAEARRLADEMRMLSARRVEMAPPIPPALMKRYDTIRAVKQGVGIGRIEDGGCGACHTQLPSNLLREVLERDAVANCENCGRLLCGEEA